MDTNALYDLLKFLSNTGREVAAQLQGSTGDGIISLESLQKDDVPILRAFAEQISAHTEVWQSMPHAGISLSDVSRCCSESTIHQISLCC